MIMSLATPIYSFAENVNYNEPDDPIIWPPTRLQPGQLGYIIKTMQPIITGINVTKYVYTDKSFDEQFLVKEDIFYIEPEEVVFLYVKFVTVLWNGDTVSEYYLVEVH
jgi:hypothetical protein